jgi:hypothetical protein
MKTLDELTAIAEEAVLNEHGNYNDETKRAAQIAAEAIWRVLTDVPPVEGAASAVA